MKKIITFILVLLFALSGCSKEQEQPIGFEEQYSGTVTDVFTEGKGDDIANVVAVDIGGGKLIYFTVTPETKIERHLIDVNEISPMTFDEIGIGSEVEVICESFENSGYHPIIEIKIIQKKLR